MLLTHAHIDHSGVLPYLYKNGFNGNIFATGATHQLCNIMLLDSAHIQETEAEWKNRKAQRAGSYQVEPLYTTKDALGALSLFKSVSYGEKVQVAEGITAVYIDAGHILGSSSILVEVSEEGVSRKILFSGDIGSLDQPLINDPVCPGGADYVLIEGTYGDRLHNKRADYAKLLAEIFERTFDQGGNVVMPAFAVGRTQEILYFIRQIKERNLVKGHGDFPVYVDSPLAIEATQVFSKHTYGYYDEEAMALIKAGVNPLSFSGLKVSLTSDESKLINFDKTPKVILSASGMCEAGRIRHHLKHNLWRPECAVVFSGYQAYGTLGRALLEGAEKVKLFGDEIEVKSSIINMEGISAHADKNELLKWLSCLSYEPVSVFVVHAEDSVADSFAAAIREEKGFSASAPFLKEEFDLAANLVVKPGELPEKKAAAPKRVSPAFEALLRSGERLLSLIRKNQGLANKSAARFADEVNALIKKWDD